MIVKETTLYNGEPTFEVSPEEGKELVRKDGVIFREPLLLGYNQWLGGKMLNERYKEVPDDYTEQDLTEDEEPTEYIEPEPEESTEYLDEYEYKELTEKYIRQRYSISDELAIMRQRDTKPDDFKLYYDYCEECKAKAKEEATHNYI